MINLARGLAAKAKECIQPHHSDSPADRMYAPLGPLTSWHDFVYALKSAAVSLDPLEEDMMMGVKWQAGSSTSSSRYVDLRKPSYPRTHLTHGFAILKFACSCGGEKKKTACQWM